MKNRRFKKILETLENTGVSRILVTVKIQKNHRLLGRMKDYET